MITDQFFLVASTCGALMVAALVLLFRPQQSISDEEAAHSEMLTIERFQMRRRRVLKYAVIPLAISMVCGFLFGGTNLGSHRGFLKKTGSGLQYCIYEDPSRASKCNYASLTLSGVP